MPIPQHTSKSFEHYSPPHIFPSIRRVMGDIDLDPASCAEANQVVRSRQIYTIEHDGLSLPWKGRIFLNPPYGRSFGYWKKADLLVLYEQLGGPEPALAKSFRKHELVESIIDRIDAGCGHWDDYELARRELKRFPAGETSLVSLWVSKLLREWRYGNVKQAILLVKNATETTFFQPLWNFPVHFPAGRYQFWGPGSSGNGAGSPHASVLVYVAPDTRWTPFDEVFSEYGEVRVPTAVQLNLGLSKLAFRREKKGCVLCKDGCPSCDVSRMPVPDWLDVSRCTRKHKENAQRGFHPTGKRMHEQYRANPDVLVCGRCRMSESEAKGRRTKHRCFKFNRLIQPDWPACEGFQSG